MTRADLHAPLLRAARAAGVDVRTGSEVVGAEPAGALLTAWTGAGPPTSSSAPTGSARGCARRSGCCGRGAASTS